MVILKYLRGDLMEKWLVSFDIASEGRMCLRSKDTKSY